MHAAAAAHSPNPNTNPPPLFYSATAGLYASTHPPLPLPSYPDLSLVLLSSSSSSFDALLDSDTAGLPAPAVGQDAAAAILYSSGTSGRSKGVVLTHHNLISMVELFVRFEASQHTRPACDNVYSTHHHGAVVSLVAHIQGASISRSTHVYDPRSRTWASDDKMAPAHLQVLPVRRVRGEPRR